MIQDKILLVGCGNMGTALLKGWVSYGVKKSNICVIEPKGIDLINSIKSSDTARSIFEINGKSFKIPKLLQNENENKQSSNEEIKEALNFNKNLMKETIVTPSNLRFPISRNILEMYYN